MSISSMEPDPAAAPDFHHNMNDAIAILAKLQTGLDVNVKFTGVKDFEYTSECIIFDLLGISLYHGWLVDPQDIQVAEAVSSLSYNQAVEAIITGRASEDTEKVARALLCEQWLEDSASQLTYHGLCELNSVMKEGQTAVFFRNNHFSTCIKAGNTVYLLVTDQGFLHQPVVWEALDNIQVRNHTIILFGASLVYGGRYHLLSVVAGGHRVLRRGVAAGADRVGGGAGRGRAGGRGAGGQSGGPGAADAGQGGRLDQVQTETPRRHCWAFGVRSEFTFPRLCISKLFQC